MLLPSVVHIGKGGRIAVGERARRALETDPANARTGFKPLLGTRARFLFPAAQMERTPAELSTELLRALRDAVKAETGTLFEQAVITVPALLEVPSAGRRPTAGTALEGLSEAQTEHLHHLRKDLLQLAGERCTPSSARCKEVDEEIAEPTTWSAQWVSAFDLLEEQALFERTLAEVSAARSLSLRTRAASPGSSDEPGSSAPPVSSGATPRACVGLVCLIGPRTFARSPEEVAEARAIVSAFESARAERQGSPSRTVGWWRLFTPRWRSEPSASCGGQAAGERLRLTARSRNPSCGTGNRASIHVG